MPEHTGLPPIQRRRVLYTIPQVAGDLKVSERYIWKLIAQQKILTVNVGPRCRRITQEEHQRLTTEGLK